MKQQLGHVCGLAIHCDGHHELAAAFEGGGQRYIHLVEAGVDALCAGICHGASMFPILTLTFDWAAPRIPVP